MDTITLRPVDPQRDFAEMAALFSLIQEQPTSESELLADYEGCQARLLCLTAAENARGELVGFNWVTRSRLNSAEAVCYLVVKPEHRRQGVGSRLAADAEQAARVAPVQRMEIGVRDHCPEYRDFAEGRGFTVRRHIIGMTFDLSQFDDRPYEATLAQLRAEGFQFTSMEALGNTEDAQRKLYALNDSAAADTPGSEGIHPWLSFEDFRQQVCASEWYHPAGQMVVIDSATGEWASMSAITRFAGADYAYNLFTGTDRRYRGRKLAQAVKVLALRYARGVLGVNTVKTHHNALNAPMIAIDRKLGYIQTPGYYAMQKELAP